MASSLGATLRRHRYAVVLAALGIWFLAGAEWMRVEKGRLRSAEELATRGAALVWPPWRILQLYVSHDGDERLYYEYSRLLLGEPADLERIAGTIMGDEAATRADLEASVARRRGPRWPYRDVHIGYPPLGVAAMLLPRLVSTSLAAYRVAFGASMLLLYLAGLLVARALARLGGDDRDGPTWERQGAALLFALGPILVGRYDALPALLAIAATLFFAARRPTLAALTVILGLLAKLFPLLLAPLFIALGLGFGGPLGATARRFALTLVAVAGLALLGAMLLGLDLRGPLESALLFRDRPFQIESLVGGFALAAGAQVVGSFGSHNAVAPGLAALAPHWGLAMAAILSLAIIAAGLWARRHRHLGERAQRLALARFSLALLLLLLVTSKVLSPQYLFWLAPFLLAVAPTERRLLPVAIVLGALTQVEFPTLYGLLLARHPALIAVLGLRNLVLVALLVLAARGAWTSPPPQLPTVEEGAARRAR